MFYRTNDFRINLALYSAILIGSVYEGHALIENASEVRVMQIGLASIASLSSFLTLIEVGVINKLEASLINNNVSFGLLPVIFTTIGTITHIYFYILMLDKGLPFKEYDPLLKGYVSFCYFSVAMMTLYNYLKNDDTKRFAR